MCAVGDGSVHPLAAQTIAFLKRLLAFRSAAAVVFAEGEPTGEAFGMVTRMHSNCVLHNDQKNRLSKEMTAVASRLPLRVSQADCALLHLRHETNLLS